MRARQLTNLIYALLEGINDTSAYYLTDKPILEYFEDNKDRLFLRVNDDPLVYRFVFKKDILANYKKNLKYVAYNPSWKYIYQLKQRMEVFNLVRDKDVSYLIDKGILKEGATQAPVNSIDGLRKYIDWQAVSNYGVLGFRHREELDVLVVDKEVKKFLSGLILVDGNAKRYDTGTNQDIQIPPEVMRELIAYTNNTDDIFSEKTTEWLQKNIPRPYKEITLYRSFGVRLDDLYDERDDRETWEEPDNYEDDEDNEYSSDEEYNDNEISIYDLMEILKRFIGITEPDEFRKGMKVTVTRNKESSWSTSPQVSASFSSDEMRDFNVMVKATVPASLVVVDLNQLPKQLLQDKFKYWTQNEVILANTSIPATIANVWISKDARSWLTDMDYQFSPTKGITEWGM